MALVLGLNLVYLVVELVGALMTGSMALLSDAGHMLTDVAAIGLGLFASRLALKPRDAHRTYGYLRAEILGAAANGAALIAICGYILLEAYQRIGVSHPIPGGPVLIIASAGLVINLLSAKAIGQGYKSNLNLRGVYLHMVVDALGSVSAMAAGLVILVTGWTPIDTLASVLIAVLVLYSGWQLLARAIEILMEGTPPEIDYDQVKTELEEREHIQDIHDLHIWTISSGVLALSAHIRMTDACLRDGHWPECLKATQALLRERWGIEHTTLQTEPLSYEEYSDANSPGI